MNESLGGGKPGKRNDTWMNESLGGEKPGR